MSLSEFVKNHPGCVVGRPSVALPLASNALAGAGLILMVVLAVRAAQSSGGPELTLLCAAVALAVAARFVSRWKHLRDMLSVLRRGTSSYAISDDELVLINAAGSAVVIELSQIVRLELDGDEVRLSTDADQPGLVYAAMFDLFEREGPRPDGRRFFEQLAPRVERRAPNAVIFRRSLAERAFVTSRPVS